MKDEGTLADDAEYEKALAFIEDDEFIQAEVSPRQLSHPIRSLSPRCLSPAHCLR